MSHNICFCIGLGALAVAGVALENNPFAPKSNPQLFPVSWSRLSTDPDKYHGKHIYMDGWIRILKTSRGITVDLFESKEALDYARMLSSVKLEGKLIEKESLKQLQTGQFVECSGLIEAYPIEGYEEKLGVLKPTLIQIFSTQRVETATLK